MKKRVLLSAIFVSMITIASAQLATINTQKVLVSIPEIAKIDTLVQAELSRLEVEFEKKKQAVLELEQIVNTPAKGNAKSKPNKQASEDLAAKQKELQDYQLEANKKYTEYRNLLYKPYIEKINNTIKTVAARRRVMQVIDLQQLTFIYINEEADITNEVIQELKN
jgi:Skp family chaperone for outer membrane proteins